MQYFCPCCWKALPSDLAYCPECRANPQEERSYETKLIAALHHPIPETRLIACMALGMRGRSERVRQALLDLLHDPDAFIREAVVIAISRVGSSADIARLKELEASDTVRVRLAAQRSIAALAKGERP